MIAWVCDRRGRFSPVRAATLALLVLPGLDLVLAWALGGMAVPQSGLSGARPVMAVIHGTGDWAVYCLIASLAVTPLRNVLGWDRIVPLRRMIGVAAACYAVAHFLLYVVDQKYNLLVVFSEIALRFYLTIGFLVLLGLIALAWTSRDRWITRLGRRWKQLHRLAYLLAPLALFHYALQSKLDVSAAMIVAGLFVWEGLWRLMPRARRLEWWPLPLLALATGIVTAGIEVAWYGLATRVDPLRVLQSNLDLSYGPRPAMAVLLCAILLSLLALLRRVRRTFP